MTGGCDDSYQTNISIWLGSYLIVDVDEDLLRWAFACVRSRAFAVPPRLAPGDTTPSTPSAPGAGVGAGSSPTEFWFAPLVDLANHADDPSCDFRVTPDGYLELFSVRDLDAGAEATISYTSKQRGYTNQRMMAQYGFVPVEHGPNPSDRVCFLAALGLDPDTDEMADYKGIRLSGARLQRAMGDEMWMYMAQGLDPYLASAVRSLPIATDEEDEENSEKDAHSRSPVSAEETKLVRDLLDHATTALESITTTDSGADDAGKGTSLSEDQAWLMKVQDVVEKRCAVGQMDGEEIDAAYWWAVVYRKERKALLMRVITTLQQYQRALEEIMN